MVLFCDPKTFPLHKIHLKHDLVEVAAVVVREQVVEELAVEVVVVHAKFKIIESYMSTVKFTS